MKGLCALLTCLAACSDSVSLFERIERGPDAGNTLGELDASSADGGQPRASEVQLASGLSHTCLVRSERLFCWGDGSSGQLGLGDTTSRDRPTAIAAANRFLSVCAGEQHTCALRNDATVLCWGKNIHGELGIGDFETRRQPTSIPNLEARAIACGGFNTCALRLDGKLSCWGDNFEGKLGLDDPFDSKDVAIPSFVRTDKLFRKVSIGQGHVCAVDSGGALWCWGRNTDGQLGDGSEQGQLRAPVRVGAPAEFVDVAAGQQHTCAIRRDRTLWCWGRDLHGDLGLGVPAGTVLRSPAQIPGATSVSQLSLKWFHTCAIDALGALSCWGRNVEGQLGLGDLNDRSKPARVGTLDDYRTLTVGHFHTCAARSEELYCWGENMNHGQLGLGDRERRNLPAKVALP